MHERETVMVGGLDHLLPRSEHWTARPRFIQRMKAPLPRSLSPGFLAGGASVEVPSGQAGGGLTAGAVHASALVLAVDGAASGALAAAAAERCPELQPVIIAALAKASA